MDVQGWTESDVVRIQALSDQAWKEMELFIDLLCAIADGDGPIGEQDCQMVRRVLDLVVGELRLRRAIRNREAV